MGIVHKMAHGHQVLFLNLDKMLLDSKVKLDCGHYINGKAYPKNIIFSCHRVVNNRANNDDIRSREINVAENNDKKGQAKYCNSWC